MSFHNLFTYSPCLRCFYDSLKYVKSAKAATDVPTSVSSSYGV